MAGTLNANWWQYSRWVWNISRTLRQNKADVIEQVAIETFIKFFYNPSTMTGSRPELASMMNKRSVSQVTGYIGNPEIEPDNVDREVLGAIGRVLKEVPITDAEVAVCDALFADTGNRRYREFP